MAAVTSSRTNRISSSLPPEATALIADKNSDEQQAIKSFFMLATSHPAPNVEKPQQDMAPSFSPFERSQQDMTPSLLKEFKVFHDYAPRSEASLAFLKQLFPNQTAPIIHLKNASSALLRKNYTSPYSIVWSNELIGLIEKIKNYVRSLPSEFRTHKTSYWKETAEHLNSFVLTIRAPLNLEDCSDLLPIFNEYNIKSAYNNFLVRRPQPSSTSEQGEPTLEQVERAFKKERRKYKSQQKNQTASPQSLQLDNQQLLSQLLQGNKVPIVYLEFRKRISDDDQRTYIVNWDPELLSLIKKVRDYITSTQPHITHTDLLKQIADHLNAFDLPVKPLGDLCMRQSFYPIFTAYNLERYATENNATSSASSEVS